MDVKEDDNVCIVCWREIHVYAIGLCDHPVCHECSTRMRVLCRKSECPICRRNLPKVIFVKQAKPFEELNKRLYQVDAHPQVCFEDDSVRQAYRSLLENRCKYCPPGPKRTVFTNFGMLRTHVRREHHRTFCDLCVEHLKIFPGERTAYSKKDLARHLHTGDLDDTSHKGHPLCQFCDVRYFDNDELYRHLRREHYYCHFCGDDYRLQYYRNYEYLRDHFRQEHFLCEEGDCRNETFTAAFRSEIDLKAHRAQHHNRSMTKAQAKQARTLDLEFSIAPRGTHHGGGSAGASGHHEDGGPVRRLPRHSGVHQRPNRSTGFPQDESRDEQPTRSLLSATQRPAARQSQNLDLTWETQPPVDYHCDKEFPQLCSEGATAGVGSSAKTGSFMPTPYSSRRPEQVNFNSVDEFPSLNPSSAPPQPSSSALRTLSSATRAASSAMRAPASAMKAHSSATRATSSATRAPPSAMGASSSATGTLSSAKSQSNGPTKGRGYQEDRNNNSGSNGYSGSDYSANVTVRLVQPPSSAVTSASAVVSARSGPKVQPAPKGPPKPVSEEDFPVLMSRVVPRMSKVSAVPPATAVEAGPPWQQVKTKTKKKKADEPKQAANPRAQQLTVANNSSSNNTNNNNPPAPKSSASKPSAPTSSSSTTKPAASKAPVTNPSSSATHSSQPAQQSAPATATNNMTNGTNATNNLLQLISAARKGNSARPAPPPLATSDGESSDSDDDKRNTTGTTILSQSDFPCLNGRPTAAPPGFQKPKPPPGFARSADTISVGISLASMAAAVPSAAPQAPRYTQPAGFQQRNLKLIVEIQKILTERKGEENDLFAQFKSLSGAFRQGTLSAADYYARCIEVFGSEERFQVVFPELLFLLPDIRKQQELMGTYNAHRKACGSSTGALPKNGAAAAVQLLVCATCQQVLSADDFRSHRTLHDPV
ncbi:unnamed protein product [Ixodes hexagonus]